MSDLTESEREQWRQLCRNLGPGLGLLSGDSGPLSDAGLFEHAWPIPPARPSRLRGLTLAAVVWMGRLFR